MPPGAVYNHDCLYMFWEVLAEVCQIKTHDSGIKSVKQKCVLISSCRPDGTYEVGTFEAILARQCWTTAFQSPYFRYNSFLAKSSLVLEPDLKGFPGVNEFLLLEEILGFFFHSSIATGSFFG